MGMHRTDNNTRKLMLHGFYHGRISFISGWAIGCVLFSVKIMCKSLSYMFCAVEADWVLATMHSQENLT